MLLTKSSPGKPDEEYSCDNCGHGFVVSNENGIERFPFRTTFGLEVKLDFCTSCSNDIKAIARAEVKIVLSGRDHSDSVKALIRQGFHPTSSQPVETDLERLRRLNPDIPLEGQSVARETSLEDQDVE